MLFFVKKIQKNLVMSKKCSTFAPAFRKLDFLSPSWGSPKISNFWGEREHGENLYEQFYCESY